MLTDRHRAILDFERLWTKFGTERKADAIAGTFGVTANRYYQLLRWLCYQPAAREYAPEVTEPWLSKQSETVRQQMKPRRLDELYEAKA